MGRIGIEEWASLERWSPTLFLAAGGILTIYAALIGVGAFTDISLQQNVFQFGYVLGFLGLFGLYPTLADRSPWLARVGAVGGALGIVAFSVITLNTLADSLGLVSGEPPGGPLFVLLAAAGFFLGFLLLGVASLRSEVYSRTVGFVLLVPAIIIGIMIAHIALGYDTPETAFVISGGQAMAHLAIGASLHTKTDSTDRKESSTDDEQPVMVHE